MCVTTCIWTLTHCAVMCVYVCVQHVGRMTLRTVLEDLWSTCCTTALPPCLRCARVSVCTQNTSSAALKLPELVFHRACEYRAACSTIPCLASDSYTTTNCSLYRNKECTSCVKCSASDNLYIGTDCSEFGNRVCASTMMLCVCVHVEQSRGTECGVVHAQIVRSAAHQSTL